MAEEMTCITSDRPEDGIMTTNEDDEEEIYIKNMIKSEKDNGTQLILDGISEEIGVNELTDFINKLSLKSEHDENFNEINGESPLIFTEEFSKNAANIASRPFSLKEEHEKNIVYLNTLMTTIETSDMTSIVSANLKEISKLLLNEIDIQQLSGGGSTTFPLEDIFKLNEVVLSKYTRDSNKMKLRASTSVDDNICRNIDHILRHVQEIKQHLSSLGYENPKKINFDKDVKINDSNVTNAIELESKQQPLPSPSIVFNRNYTGRVLQHKKTNNIFQETFKQMEINNLIDVNLPQVLGVHELKSIHEKKIPFHYIRNENFCVYTPNKKEFFVDDAKRKLRILAPHLKQKQIDDQITAYQAHIASNIAQGNDVKQIFCCVPPGCDIDYTKCGFVDCFKYNPQVHVTDLKEVDGRKIWAFVFNLIPDEEGEHRLERYFSSAWMGSSLFTHIGSTNPGCFKKVMCFNIFSIKELTVYNSNITETFAIFLCYFK
jgi:hypothetical protein